MINYYYIYRIEGDNKIVNYRRLKTILIPIII